MAVKLSEVMTASTFFWNSADWEAKLEERKAHDDAEALEYLRAKFPGVDDEVFFTDYMGTVSNHVVDAGTVCKAGKIERVCSSCKGKCTLQGENGRPVVRIQESPRGFNFLDIRWTCGIPCKYQKANDDFERMYQRSGLLPSQRGFTFGNYKVINSELSKARAKALDAVGSGENLVLAGKWGTGKTHLAVAIAMIVMNKGQQAIFRLVSTMIDELREANFNGDYYGLMRRFSEVSCLVLDDLGKERDTEAGREYLYQIIDYRYVHKLQTILTTNALTIEELARWGRAEYIQPMISRLLERGSWVTIANSSDYRLTRGK